MDTKTSSDIGDVRPDTTKTPIILNTTINKLQDAFLNSVSTNTYTESKYDLSVCIMKPGGRLCGLWWCKEFITSKYAADMKKEGLSNNLESILHYETNVNLPASAAFALLESIAEKMKPSQIHMIDHSSLEPDKCRIVFKFPRSMAV